MARVCLAQMTTGSDVSENIARAERLVVEAAAQGAQLLAFPEVFLFVGPHPGKLAIAEEIPGPRVQRFCALAAEHQISLLLGSVHEVVSADANAKTTSPTGQPRVHNTSVLIDATGKVTATYRKQKLFDIDLPETKVRESDSFLAGSQASPIVPTPIGRVGLAICFDLRFPELFLDLAARGAEVIFVPSNFTAETGAAHWETLLRARAIENQLFIAAPAQVGQNSASYRSFGHSMVVDPWGRVLSVLADDEGLVTADIDLAVLAQVRRRLPMR